MKQLGKWLKRIFCFKAKGTNNIISNGQEYCRWCLCWEQHWMNQSRKHKAETTQVISYHVQVILALCIFFHSLISCSVADIYMDVFLKSTQFDVLSTKAKRKEFVIFIFARLFLYVPFFVLRCYCYCCFSIRVDSRSRALFPSLSYIQKRIPFASSSSHSWRCSWCCSYVRAAFFSPLSCLLH